MTDANGQLVWSATYRAYGNVLRQDVAVVDNPLRFQGQYYDPETGLHYNRHRYYNPANGRFMTPDPIGLAGGLNNYQYVPNPIGWVDPLGLACESGACPGEREHRTWGDLPRLPNDEPGQYLYRGVHAEHPDLSNALGGKVTPGNVEGSVSADAHNLGGQSANSPFTSWTRSPEIARKFASGKGDGGVILRVPVGAPTPNDNWAWEWSPDEWGKQEILLKGPRQNIEVFRP